MKTRTRLPALLAVATVLVLVGAAIPTASAMVAPRTENFVTAVVSCDIQLPLTRSSCTASVTTGTF